MDEQTTVLEAGLGWIVSWPKERFVGAERLRQQKAAGLTRKLVGFEMTERAIARHGHPIMRGGSPCGVVTSGTQTPFLKKAIGLAMVPIDLSEVGTSLEIDGLLPQLQRATLHVVEDGDHSFKVRARSGQKPDQVIDGIMDVVVSWMTGLTTTKARARQRG